MSTLYGLVGRTLGHSFSASYFAEKFRREGIDAKYVNFELSDIGMLPAIIAAHPDLRGLNVTIPYKASVIPYLDELDPVAQAIGAVNVIKIVREGDAIGMKGFNTDAPGFAHSFCPLMDDGGGRALVLGNGGAAAAVKYALDSLGLPYTSVSRMPQNGKITYAEVDENVISTHKYIINCTPLGTYPDVEDCPMLRYELITPVHVAVDIVYNPGCTAFMQRCAERGAVVRNGLDMLYTQAELAYKIWRD